jgi:hypothetical protein
MIVVRDTLAALGDLAGSTAAATGPGIVAVTGSNGEDDDEGDAGRHPRARPRAGPGAAHDRHAEQTSSGCR